MTAIDPKRTSSQNHLRTYLIHPWVKFTDTHEVIKFTVLSVAPTFKTLTFQALFIDDDDLE